MEKTLNGILIFLCNFVVVCFLIGYFTSDSYTMKIVSGDNAGAIINKRLIENYSIGDTTLLDNQKVVVIKID
jgi:hypothetical protein